MREPILLVSRTYRELTGYIENRICEMDDVDILGTKIFLIGALSALEQLHEKELNDAKDAYNCERCTK